MLSELFPRDHGRFLSLPILGPVVDGFAQWLTERGYPRASARRHIRASRRIDFALRQRGFRKLSGITASDLLACSAAGSQDDVVLAAAARCLSRYLEERGLLAAVPEAPSRSRALLSVYAEYLRDVRGFARGTLASHLRSATQILERLDYETAPSRLSALSGTDLEYFLKAAGQHQGRGTLQHTCLTCAGFCVFSPRAARCRRVSRHESTPHGSIVSSSCLGRYRGRRYGRSCARSTVRRRSAGGTMRCFCSSPPTDCGPATSRR